MTDPIEEAARALRETTSGDDSGIARFTRARVLARLHQQRRRRVSQWVVGLPLAAILMGSAAWAMTAERVPSPVQRVAEALGLRAPRAVEKASLGAVRTRTNQIEPSRDSSPPASEVAAEARPAASVAVASTKPMTVASAASDSALTERELSVYEAAHRVHFVEKDCARAVTAWEAYLRAMPRGRFVLEAKYNRALCLLRLGRSREARVALEPFAEGAYGAYRRADAQALLSRIDAANPQ